MKQFKVIVQQPVENGIITANFAMPIKIEPGSQVCMDKFFITVDEITGQIILLDQTILLQTNLGYPYHTVIIPGATYDSINNLVETITQYLNEAIASTNDIEIGLKIIAQVNNTSIEFVFISVDPSDLPIVETNSEIDSDAFWIYDSDAPGTGSGVMSQNILTGGGVSIQYYWRPDLVVGTTTSFFTILSADLSFNIIDELVFKQDAENSELISLSSDLSPTTFIVDSAIFYPTGSPTSRYIEISQEAGFWVVSIYETQSLEVLLARYFTDYPWTATKIYTTRFDFEAAAPTYLDLESNPGFGDIIATVEPTGIVGSGNPHTISMDFTNAQQLKAGLGILQTIITLTPQNSNYGTYNQTSPINFSAIRTAGDLSLEMLSLPLENYEVGSSPFPTPLAIPGFVNPNQRIRMPGGRKNVVCYFRPQLIEPVSNIYTFSQSEYQWLDLTNKLPIEFTSLDFKVYISTNNAPIKAQSISFNILVRDKEEAYGFQRQNGL